MLQFEKFYNRNQLVEHTGLSRTAIEQVIIDVEYLKIGNQQNYKGIDVLIKLNPNDAELQNIKRTMYTNAIHTRDIK